MIFPILVNFKPLTNLEQYNGSTDPLECLEGFKDVILLSNALDAIMCHAFSTTLKKAGLRWFIGPPKHSISHFR